MPIRRAHFHRERTHVENGRTAVENQFESGTPPVISPVKVALVRRALSPVVTKSSAASIWELGPREAMAIFPSVSPVLKKKVLPALAGLHRAYG